MVQTTDSRFLVAGNTETFGAGNTDLFLVRLNGMRDTLWTKTIGGISDDYAHTIHHTSDGGFIISGFYTSHGAGQSASRTPTIIVSYMLSKTVFVKTMTGIAKSELALEKLPAGVYEVQMIDGEKYTAMKFIVR